MKLQNYKSERTEKSASIEWEGDTIEFAIRVPSYGDMVRAQKQADDYVAESGNLDENGKNLAAYIVASIDGLTIEGVLSWPSGLVAKVGEQINKVAGDADPKKASRQKKNSGAP